MRSQRNLTASFRLHALALHLAYEGGIDEQAAVDVESDTAQGTPKPQSDICVLRKLTLEN